MCNIKFYPYNRYSKSVKALRRELPYNEDLPITLHVNWGNSDPFNIFTSIYLNGAFNVECAINKTYSFRQFLQYGLPIPRFWNKGYNLDDAIEHLTNGGILVCRMLTHSHSGRGIHIVAESDLPRVDLRDFELITEYIPKNSEYRVHVFDGRVIDVQQKRRRNGYERKDQDQYIRNYKNGWVFCRENVNPGDNVLDLAVQAVKCLGLDFGAVDIIINKYKGPFILEVNTAPGLTGTTLQKYVQAFKDYNNDA